MLDNENIFFLKYRISILTTAIIPILLTIAIAKYPIIFHMHNIDHEQITTIRY